MKGVAKFLNRHFMLKDLIISFLIIFMLFLMVYELGYQINLINLFNGARFQLYGTIASLSGTMLGFIITGLSILLTMGDSEAIRVLKLSPYYKQVYKTYIHASFYLALTTVISLCGLVIDKDASPHLFYLYVLTWSLLISFITIIRCIWILDKMIELKTKK